MPTSPAAAETSSRALRRPPPAPVRTRPIDEPDRTARRRAFWNRPRLALAVVVLARRSTWRWRCGAWSGRTRRSTRSIHLPAGVTYWQTGSFRLYHHNPPLVKLIAALPGARRRARSIDYRTRSWSAGSRRTRRRSPTSSCDDNAGRYFELFTRARLLMPALLGARRPGRLRLVAPALRRRRAACSAWPSGCFCPNVLAHAPARHDRRRRRPPSASLATFVFWLYLQGRPRGDSRRLAGVCLGLAQLTKFSLLVLYGLWPLLALVRTRARTPICAGGLGRAVAGQGSVVVALSVLVIDARLRLRGGRHPARRLRVRLPDVDEARAPRDAQAASPDALLDGAYRVPGQPVPGHARSAGFPSRLPEHYLLGFDDQKLEAEGIPKKFLDPASRTGPRATRSTAIRSTSTASSRQKSWWYYYLLTLVYKVPEGTWLLVAAVVRRPGRSRRGRGRPWFDEFAVLVVPAFVLFVMSVFTNINLGLRYVLPIFPYVFISAGKLAPWAFGLERPTARGGRRGASSGLGVGDDGGRDAVDPPALPRLFQRRLGRAGTRAGAPDRQQPRLGPGPREPPPLAGDERARASGSGLAYFGQINPRIFEARGEGFDWFLPPPAPGTMPTPAAPVSRSTRTRSGSSPACTPSAPRSSEGLPWRVYDSPVPGFDGKTPGRRTRPGSTPSATSTS